MTRAACAVVASVVLLASSDAAASGVRFPTGTFLTKITAADLYRAGLDLNDAHWEEVTYRADGTFRDVWFHPRVSDQPTTHGRYVVRGDTIRFLGTPDSLHWRYDGRALTFTVIHQPDALARLISTAHPWRQIR